MSVLNTVTSAQTAHYTIAGDVQLPETYEFSAGQTIRVGDLLSRGKQTNSAGVAVILRGSPPVPLSTEFVDSNAQHAGSALIPGDIVVFHGESPSASSNAVVVMDQIPRIIVFDSGSLTTDALLSQLNTGLHEDVRIPVIRTDGQRSVLQQLTRRDMVTHGDVIQVTGLISLPEETVHEVFVPQPISIVEEARMRDIAVSDSQNNVGHPLDITEQSAANATTDTDQSDLIMQAALQDDVYGRPENDVISTVNAGQQNAANINAATGLPLPDAAIPGSEQADDVSILFPELAVPAPAAPVSERAEITIPAPTIPEPSTPVPAAPASDSRVMRPATERSASSQTSFQQLNQPEFSMTQEDKSAPAVSTSQPQPAIKSREEQSTSSAWGFLLIGGFLIATSLIVIGWIKTRAELSTEQSAMASLTLESDEAAAPGFAKQDTVEATLTESAEFPANTVESTASTDDVEEQPAADENPMTTQKSTSSAARANAASMSISDMPIRDEAVREAEQAVSEAFAELDELIENRLPVNMRQTDLPLRINLFGKPAGPRRLRIDAAHEAIPAPHTNMTRSRSKTQSMTDTEQASMS